MPFISLSDEAAEKSRTSVENKFITKYLPVLEPIAVKVYLLASYVCQSGSPFTLPDFAQKLQISEDEVKNYFLYLEEFELVSVTSLSPFEVKISRCENVSGAPKKIKPEKYADFTKAAQDVLKGRMISPAEFREYFYLLDEYGFEQNALIMIINYCVNLRGDDIRFAYIKKVARSFGDEGIVTARQVDEKLSAYTSSTPALLKIFGAAGIRRQPDIDDDRLYNKWKKFGFEDDSILRAAKLFKPKSCERLDEIISELKNYGKFDEKEISDFYKNRNTVLDLTREIAKNLGIYVQNPTVFAENYVNVWFNYGYSEEAIKKLSIFSLAHDKTSFESMNDLMNELYDEGIISDASVENYLEKKAEEDKILKAVLAQCGLTRKITAWDRLSLQKWRSWNFGDDMISEAARLSSGKSNPIAYMNGILSTWKNDGVDSLDKIAANAKVSAHTSTQTAQNSDLRAKIESHFAELRHAAEDRAEKAAKIAEADPEYSDIRKKSNELSIKLAFAEMKDRRLADELNKEISSLDQRRKARLKELNLSEEDLLPRYACKLCNDTGYLKNGAPCECLKKYVETLKN